ncbi:daunorubicin/doxorubicin resistance ABC transporter ATP-binding protein DrrA, partial [Actinosynnema sp. NPDC023658]
RLGGGQRGRARPPPPARLADAAAVLAEVSGHQPESTGRGVVTVPVDGDAAFTEVVRRLDQRQISVTELSLRLPSLDEVFFTLTGKHTEVAA